VKGRRGPRLLPPAPPRWRAGREEERESGGSGEPGPGSRRRGATAAEETPRCRCWIKAANRAGVAALVPMARQGERRRSRRGYGIARPGLAGKKSEARSGRSRGRGVHIYVRSKKEERKLDLDMSYLQQLFTEWEQ
jgi:hypothetical protein